MDLLRNLWSRMTSLVAAGKGARLLWAGLPAILVVAGAVWMIWPGDRDDMVPSMDGRLAGEEPSAPVELLEGRGIVRSTDGGRILVPPETASRAGKLLAVSVLILAIVAGAMQVGSLFSGQPLGPDLSRLSPGKGLRRIISGGPLVRGGLGVILPSRRPGHGAEAPADGQGEPGTRDDDQIRDLPAAEAMQIDIGFALVELVDQSRGGDLLSRISTLRREIAAELGVVVPPIRIADDMRIGAHEYVIKIRGARVAAGKLYPDQLLAIVGGQTKGRLVGREATEWAFAARALWINPDQSDHAQAMGYTVVCPPQAMTAHLGETIRAHGSLLLSREQVARMLENLEDRAAALAQEVTDEAGLANIQKVLQRLLAERVSIRDLETILETLSDHTESNEDVEAITERVREALAPALCQQYCGRDGKLWCIRLDAELENAIGGQGPEGGAGLAVTDAGQVSQLVRGAVSAALDSLVADGYSPVVVCRPGIRRALRGLIGKDRPAVAVLGYNEVNSVEVQAVARVGIGQ